MRELFQRDIAYRIGDFGDVPRDGIHEALESAWQWATEAARSFERGDYLQATAIARSGLEALAGIEPSHTTLHCRRTLWEIKADAHARLQNPIEAIRCGQAVLGISCSLADSVENVLHLAVSHLSLGHYHFDAGKYGEALHHYREAKLPSNTEAYIAAELAASMADCHANLGELDQAVQATDRAIALLSLADGVDAQRILLAARDRRAFYLGWSGHCDMAALESEEVVATIRALVSSDARIESDLARSLDHRAEILERAHRLDEAIIAADESTALRRRLAEQDGQFCVSFLRSLVTLARLCGDMGNSARAIELCEEARQLITGSKPVAIPADLRAQIATCHGRNLMAADKHCAGEEQLLAAARLFRQLARESGGSAFFRDALAEVMLDLGRMHLAREPSIARHWFARATVWKRHIARGSNHPFDRAGEAEGYIWLGRAELGSGDAKSALDKFDRAIEIYSGLQILPGNFPDLAVTLTQNLIMVATKKEIGDSTSLKQIGRFERLAGALSTATDITDDELIDDMQERIDAFQRLWLEYFVDAGDGAGIVELLSFAHGRRLSLLAHTQLQSRAGSETLSGDEKAFIHLQRHIRRIDLEMAQVLSALTPSLIHDEYKVSTSELAAGAGKNMESERDRLFSDYLSLRKRLIACGRYPDISGGALNLAEIRKRIDSSTALAVWGVPRAFGCHRPPQLIIVSANSNEESIIITMPELDDASSTFDQLLSEWRFGRSGMRGSLPTSHADTNAIDSALLEKKLWRKMDGLWARIAEKLSPLGIEQLHMITHAEAHNLPWLGACPESIYLRQFPSLHWHLRRKTSSPTPTPSPDHPLILLVEEPGGDPLNTLYHIPLEIEFIRQIWPGAVIQVGYGDAIHCREASAIWIVGHGFTHKGHPIFGRGKELHPLAEASIFHAPDCHIGLIYASTCYMGQTSDIEGEPVGLASLANSWPEAPSITGAIAPVHDLGAALFALLFNIFWKTEGDPRIAFDCARKALRSGNWPESGKKILDQARCIVLPTLKQRAEEHARISGETISKLYPELNESEKLSRMFSIRTRGVECLKIWREKNAFSSLLPQAFTTTSQNTNPSNYWTWFG